MAVYSFWKFILLNVCVQVSGESTPAPTRGPNVGGDEEEEEVGGAEGGGSEGASSGAASKPVSMADLMPKVDISGQIKPELIKEMADKNWKIRAESLQKVVSIHARMLTLTQCLVHHSCMFVCMYICMCVCVCMYAICTEQMIDIRVLYTCDAGSGNSEGCQVH